MAIVVLSLSVARGKYCSLELVRYNNNCFPLVARARGTFVGGHLL